MDLKILYPDVAWNAVKNLLIVVGILALIGYVFTMHWYLIIPSLLWLVIMFYLCYHLEIKFHEMKRNRNTREAINQWLQH